MTTKTYTDNLSLSDIQQSISDLREARANYDGIDMQAFICSAFFGIAGLFTGGITTIIVGLASLANAGYGFYLDNLENLATNAIEELEEFEDMLQDNPYDLIKVKTTVKSETLDGKVCKMPTKFEVVAVHSGDGWILA